MRFKGEALTSLEHWRAPDTREGVRTLLEDRNCTAGAHLIHPAAPQSCTLLTSSGSRQAGIQQRTLQRRIDGRVHHLDFDTLICARTAMASHTSKICQFVPVNTSRIPTTPGSTSRFVLRNAPRIFKSSAFRLDPCSASSSLTQDSLNGRLVSVET